MGKGNIPKFVPFYIDFFHRPEIRRLRRWSGTDNGKDKGKGVLVYQHIMFACFNSGGYYCEENDDLYDDIAEDWGLSVNTIRLIVEYLVKQSLLTRKLLNQVKVFTSEEIQENWMYSMKGRAQKRVARGNGPIILEESIWIAENVYPQYFSLGHPFLDESKEKEEMSGTKIEMSHTNDTRVEERREDKKRVDKSRRETLIAELGFSAVQFYERRAKDFMYKHNIQPTEEKINKYVFEWAIKDRANHSGFYSNNYKKSDSAKNNTGIHNFSERKYDFDKMEMEHIKRINS